MIVLTKLSLCFCLFHTFLSCFSNYQSEDSERRCLTILDNAHFLYDHVRWMEAYRDNPSVRDGLLDEVVRSVGQCSLSLLAESPWIPPSSGFGSWPVALIGLSYAARSSLEWDEAAYRYLNIAFNLNTIDGQVSDRLKANRVLLSTFYLELGSQALNYGHFDRASLFFKKSLDEQPATWAHYALGSAFYQAGQLDNAEGSFYKVLSLEKDTTLSLSALQNLSEIHRKKKEFKKQIIILQQWKKLIPMKEKDGRAEIAYRWGEALVFLARSEVKARRQKLLEEGKGYWEEAWCLDKHRQAKTWLMITFRSIPGRDFKCH